MALKFIKVDNLIQEYFSKFSKFCVNVIAKSCISKSTANCYNVADYAVAQQTAISCLLTSLENCFADLNWSLIKYTNLNAMTYKINRSNTA